MSVFSKIMIAAAALGVALAANAAADQNKIENTEIEPAKIDYNGFVSLAGDIEALRGERLIDLDTFLTFAANEDTVILDSRSREAFEAGHLAGAVNLPFSDFTQAKLDKLIGDKNRRILIYCNNNFSDNIEPVLRKRVELALNIPTFINLHGYGYENIYELQDFISIDDPRINFVTSDL